MKTIKIIVDELPRNCYNCYYYGFIEHQYSIRKWCEATTKQDNRIDDQFHFPTWCPLVVEVPEVCEWHIKQTRQMWDENNPIYTQTRSCYKEAHYAGTLPLSNICSNCGKPIKYIESE